MFQKTKVVRKLFYANVIAFILTFSIGVFYPLLNYIALWPIDSPNFLITGFFTHLFTHGSLFHLAFNMIALLSIGPLVEVNLGKKFFPYYILMGLGAAVSQMLLGSPAPMVGASGSIFGLFAYFTLLNPNVRLAFPPMKIKWAFLAYIAIEIYCVTTGSLAQIGHFAHLGGAAMGIGLYVLENGYQRALRVFN